MKLFGPLSRMVAALGLLIAALVVAVPAQAQSDLELLQSYIGTWNGRGTLSTRADETVVCRLNLVDGNQDKVNFDGRCALAGTTMSIRGTLAYINGQFEAAITSNIQFSGTAIGRRRGDAIVFNIEQVAQDAESGTNATVTSSIRLEGGAINVEFRAVDNNTGSVTSAAIPFAR